MPPAWHIKKLGLRSIWSDYETEGRGAKVAMIDSGVTKVSGLEHVRLLAVDGEVLDEDDHDTSPEAHGTQTASILAARGSGPVQGIAPECTCLAFSVGDSDGEPMWRQVGRAMAAAVKRKVDLICCPFTFPEDAGSSAAEREFRKGLGKALAAEIPVIVSAGNDPGVQPVFPDRGDGVVVVGATNRGGQPDRFHWEDWMTVSAPGVRIPTLTGAGSVSRQFSGTSAAAPIVAGIVALAVAWARAQSDVAAQIVRKECDALLRASSIDPETRRFVDPEQFLALVVERIQS